MRVHLYATSWNEERMVPFFLRHYEPIVDRMVIFDDGSDDRSPELFQKSAKVEMRPLARGASSNVMVLEELNRCWKESRGQADWIIIADIDEFFYHPGLRDYLRDCRANGFTILHPIGMDMVHATFPETGSDLAKTVRRGVPLHWMDKPAIFDPDAIEDIYFSMGRHAATPVGRVVFPPVRDVRLLHYKHLGQDYVVRRTSELRGRKTQVDRDNGWGTHLERSPEELQRDFARLLEKAQQVI